MVGVEAVIEGFCSTVGYVGCDLSGHEDKVEILGSASVCGYFVVEAKLSGIDVDEAEARCKLDHSSCGTAKFFVEISTEYDFVIVVDFGLKE
jgi:hypothetical protein